MWESNENNSRARNVGEHQFCESNKDWGALNTQEQQMWGGVYYFVVAGSPLSVFLCVDSLRPIDHYDEDWICMKNHNDEKERKCFDN